MPADDELHRPVLTPRLAYDSEAIPLTPTPAIRSGFTPAADPNVAVFSPPLSAVITDTARPILYFTSQSPSHPSELPPPSDSMVVFDAVFRLINAMTTRRFWGPRQLSEDGDPPSVSQAGDTDADFTQELACGDYQFQLANPELKTGRAVLADGAFVAFNAAPSEEAPVTGGSASMTTTVDESSSTPSLWDLLLSYVPVLRTPQRIDDESDSDRGEEDDLVCPARTVLVSEQKVMGKVQLDMRGPTPPPADVVTSFQGYLWKNLDQYRYDQMSRRQHFRAQLIKTRQFLQTHTRGPSTQTEPLAPREVPAGDTRRNKRDVWFALYGVAPESRIFFKLKYFHTKPAPVFDHFQLKNLLWMDGPLVYYLSHSRPQLAGRTFSCITSYNLQTGVTQKVLGPWSFNIARNLFTSSGPLYHSLSSISFESRYLFSLSVSKNFVATSDTSSSILLANKPDRRAKAAAPVRRSEDPAVDSFGDRILCQRVSAQPLQIINSIILIEDAQHPEVRATAFFDHELIQLIAKQAEVKGKIIFKNVCNTLEHRLKQFEPRVALARAWSRFKYDVLTDTRTLRRLRTLYSPATIARTSPNDDEGVPSLSRLVSLESSNFLPTPTSLTVLTAGNDRTLCEYSLDETICTNPTHVVLEDGQTVCKTRRGFVSGFSACVKNPATGIRTTRSLKLNKSWAFPFCINKVAIHPNNNLLIVVGDSPNAVLAARTGAPIQSYFGKRGSIKNSLITLSVHQDASFAAAWHPDGYMFATGSDDRTIATWDLRNLLCPIAIIKTEVTACRSLLFSPDGRYLLSCESEDAVVVYSVAHKFKLAQKIPFFGGCTGAAFSSDSQRVVLGIGAPGSAGGILELVINKIPYHAVHFDTYQNNLDSSK